MADMTIEEWKEMGRQQWMFELIAALKDEVLDLRIDRDTWRALALAQHTEAHDREVK